jgi:GT2 family glycosyltransferase
LEVPKLSGFCLPGRREVLTRLGALDERIGPGFFDDDDLCVRARQAGFLLLVAADVFVHHFGGRTFLGLGIDTAWQMEANLERFRTKWGPGATTGYRRVDLPAAGLPAPATPKGRPRRSLTMIVRNE